MNKKLSGFTIVELLVVISIVATLVALLLPAIQLVREAARRTGCQNRQRQIGLALTSYHSTHRSFPIGCDQWRPFGSKNERQIAWCAHLLPLLELENVSRQLDLSLAFDHDSNKQAGTQNLPVFLCPSNNREWKKGQLGPSDFGGIFGERISSPNQPPKGILIHDIPIRARDVSDGLSNTLIVSEDSTSSDGQWINGRNLFDQAFPINSAPKFENDIRSQHTEGAVACFADGHIRFLSNSTDIKVLASICTRAGSETTHAN